MKNNKGFIELKSVSDYWKKLLFDYTELKKRDNDTYIAFNFFVTAYHLLDWVFEGNYSDERTELNKEPILKICSHIANGIKHFEPKRHNSVKKIKKKGLYEEGFYEEGFYENPIIIYIDDDFISDIGNSIRISDLAQMVIEFWEKELKKRNLI
jgi:hypothetical protein